MLHLYYHSLKFIIVSSFFVTCAGLYGQENVYFENQPVWHESTMCAIPAPCIETDEYNYYIEGDTILDGITYVKLFKQGVISRVYYDNNEPEWCTGSESYTDQLKGYVRSANRQIFYRTPSATQEQLLYDFNLSIGDTIPHTFTTNPWGDAIVVAIDSLQVMDSYYMRFHLEGTDGPAPYIIEGIGSSKGLIAPIPQAFECGFTLNCYSRDATIYFGDGDNGSCLLSVGVDEIPDLPQISLYPNPATDVVQVELAEVTGQVEISVHNLAGKEVKHATARGEQLYQLNCGDLPNGLYVLMLRQNDLVLHSTKLAVLR